MALDARDVTACIGSEVRAPVEVLLDPANAAELRALLIDRGVLVFKQLNLTDDQQVTLASHLGALRAEGQMGIFKITLDQDGKRIVAEIRTLLESGLEEPQNS